MMPTWTRRLRLQGHAVSPEWLWIVQWMLGVLGVLWALLIGTFVTLGGAEYLTGQMYLNLIGTFRDYHVIGAVNILGGVLGAVGLVGDWRWVSVASASVCAMWNGLLAMFIIPANWLIPGGGNLLGIYALFVMLVYLMRVVLLAFTPRGPTVKLL